MINVNVSISGIIQNCDEGFMDLHIGSGFSIVRKKLDELWFKERVVDGNGRLKCEYYGSRISETEDAFLCIQKTEVIQIDSPRPMGNGAKKVVFTDEDVMCEDQLRSYQHASNESLHEFFSLLKVYQDGNVGLYETFYQYKYRFVLGESTRNSPTINVSRNNIDFRKYKLDHEKTISCNKFLSKYSVDVYFLMKPVIDMFVGGLEQVDFATGFEKYTTALEMLLLESHQPGIKQMLSKRVAMLVGVTSHEISSIYANMINYYSFRSESVHDGDASSINKEKLHELENITRKVITKTLERCRSELTMNSSLGWDDIKKKQINGLKAAVKAAVSNGILPA